MVELDWIAAYLPYLGVALLITAALWKSRRPPCKFPPGSEGLPVLGSLPLLGGEPERTLAQWGWMHYGPVFYFKAGNRRVVVLNTLEAAQEGFIKKGNDLSGRYRPCCGGEQLAFSDFSPKWKDQRKLRISTLKGFEKQNVDAVLAEEASRACGELESHVKADASKAFMPAQFTTLATFNAVSMVISGIRIHSETESDRHELLHCLIDPIYNQHCEGLFSLKTVLPDALKSTFEDDSDRSLRKRVDLLLGEITSRDSIKNSCSSSSSSSRSDFVCDFLAKMQSNGADQPSEGYYSKPELLRYLSDLFMAGTDTMATSVAWALVLLAADQEYQNLARDEIDRVAGKESPGVAMVDAMPYNRAVMQEVFRVRPVFPLSISHQSTSDTEIMGYKVPNNTTVMANLWAVHNDAKHWKDPLKFRPGRHLNDDGEFVKSDKVIPFSIGPRYCLGGQLATTQFFIFVTSLLQRFVFELDRPYTEEQLQGLNSVVLAPRGIKLKASLRDSNEA